MCTVDGRKMEVPIQAVRTLDVCLRLCTLVVVAVYCGNLTASLAVPKIQWPFTNLHGLAHHKEYDFLIQEGTVREDVLRVSIKLLQ